ncbi:P-loop NTPase fold protein [Actinopolymorpha pittospori]|uniref:KAP NTPase domain-containing protein n=1 Tax=Actinopolymorpha pittospori TaxID=648752 RepID=A0A927MS21_9ACTN|nr:hypothetical protein [Actinopolymorpha pittospori]
MSTVTMARIPEPFVGHAGAVRAVAVLPGGGSIVTGGADAVLRVWELRTGRLLQVHSEAENEVLALAVSEDNRVVSCGQAMSVSWDLAAGTSLLTPLGTHLMAAAVLPHGEIVAIDLDQKILQPLSGRNWRSGHQNVNSVAVSANRQVVTGGSDPIVRITDWSGKELGRLPGRSAGSVATAVSNDGTRVAIGTSDSVRFWDRRQRSGVISLNGCDDAAITVAVTPDGGQVIAGGYNGGIWVWDPQRPDEPLQMDGHNSAVRSLAVTPDSRQLVSGAEDGAIGVWDLTTGARISPSRSPRPQAGLVSDQESAVDLLGFAEDVDSVATLIGDRATEPPLAIALLGRWGSGKSSFMRQLQNRVARLAEQGRRNPAHSVFATTVRQVRFNAWHYNDDHLWVGMVEHLFTGLGEPEPRDAYQVGAERTALRERLHDLEELADSNTSPTKRFRARLRLWLAALAPWRGRIAVAGTAFVLLGAVTGMAWWQWRSDVLALVSGVLAATAVFPILDRLLAAWRAVRSLAERRAAGLRQAVHDTRMRLARLDATRELTLVIEQGRAGGYDQYRGLLGRVYADLRQLSDSAEQAFAEWEQAGSAGPPPLERVVLYIDDLDRCSPRKVVDVLAAVHLLLALRLFIVVVAVDPQWLRHCLEQYHSELFGGTDGVTGVAPLDYLDKIFQVVFTLRPMGSEVDRFIEALVPTETVGPQPLASETGTASATADAPARSAETGSGPATTPQPDQLSGPQPAQLRLRASELRFIQRLHPLLLTPRAVKRFVNVYRLQRAAISEEELDGFIGSDDAGPYQAVLVLLAVLVAAPESCRTLAARLDVVDGAAGDAGFTTVVEELATSARTAETDQIWMRLLEILRAGDPVHDNLSTYRAWTGTIGRFSFETWDLTKPR